MLFEMKLLRIRSRRFSGRRAYLRTSCSMLGLHDMSCTYTSGALTTSITDTWAPRCAPDRSIASLWHWRLRFQTEEKLLPNGLLTDPMQEYWKTITSRIAELSPRRSYYWRLGYRHKSRRSASDGEEEGQLLSTLTRDQNMYILHSPHRTSSYANEILIPHLTTLFAQCITSLSSEFVIS